MNDLAKYLHKVRSYLPGNRKRKNWTIQQIEESIITGAENASYEELVERYGAPKTVAATQIESMPASELAEIFRVQGWIKKTVLAIAGFIITLVLVACIVEIIDGINANHGYGFFGDAIIESRGFSESTEGEAP